MKNKLLSFIIYVCFAWPATGQQTRQKYPDPEFSNEVSLLQKDSSLTRLEKGSSLNVCFLSITRILK